MRRFTITVEETWEAVHEVMAETVEEALAMVDADKVNILTSEEVSMESRKVTHILEEEID
jgi:hypothetical protein